RSKAFLTLLSPHPDPLPKEREQSPARSVSPPARSLAAALQTNLELPATKQLCRLVAPGKFPQNNLAEIPAGKSRTPRSARSAPTARAQFRVPSSRVSRR